MKPWKCSKGCKLRPTPCKHLEDLIAEKRSEPRFESVNRYVGNNVEKGYYESGAGFVIPEGIRNRSYEYQFRDKLEKAGLEPVRVDIMTLRFVYDMSIKEIQEELGVMSASTVVRLMNESLATLKERYKK